MKKIILMATAVAALALVGCGKKDADLEAAIHTGEAAKTAQQKASAPGSASDAPRAAVYDPNLKPAEIVWDSPEKKKAWEARQAQLKAGK